MGKEEWKMAACELRYEDEISVKDYNMLREAVNWCALAEKQAETGIRNSAFIVSCMDGEQTIACARVIWDGGYVVYIADVIVLPAYQRQGIGKEMMARVMKYIKGELKPGWRIMVNLLAAKGKEEFYKKFDFIERPSESLGAGMCQWVERKAE